MSCFMHFKCRSRSRLSSNVLRAANERLCPLARLEFKSCAPRTRRFRIAQIRCEGCPQRIKVQRARIRSGIEVDQASAIISNWPRIILFSSSGGGSAAATTAGFCIIFGAASLRAACDGHTTQPRQTVSSDLQLTASEYEVSSPSGTFAPQHSAIASAPYSLNTEATVAVCLMN